MPVPIESVTTTALSAALETASRRQAAVAANIANAGAPGYLPLRLSFDAHLADARAVLQEKGLLDLAAAESLRSAAEPLFDAGGEPAAVQLDAEMATLARNAVEYQALLQGMSRHLALQALAAADVRR